MMNPSEIETVLEGRHAAANAAFVSKDIEAYQSLFSGDLQYRQLDGTTIDRTQLMRNVKTQFKRLDHVASHFTRESLEVDRQEIMETLLQIAIAEVLVFGVLRRIWNVERRGRYTWAIKSETWKIIRVEVLNETIRSRFRIGR